MAMNNPEISINERLSNAASIDDRVTLPLFIGYLSFDSGAKEDRFPSYEMVRIGSLTEVFTKFGRNGPLAKALRHFFDNRGKECYVLPLRLGEKDVNRRLQKLVEELQGDKIAEVVAADFRTGLLLVPELSELNELNDMIESGILTLWYQACSALIQLCKKGKRRFALLELPEIPSQAITLTQRLEKSFNQEQLQDAAAWWPRIMTHYPDARSKDAFLFLSPLPAVAAIIQHNALEKGVWKAPANIKLEETLRPVRRVTDTPELLNDEGVYCNPIRSFPGKGVRLWGCRTLLNDKNSPWRYIQTRLLANTVEDYLCRLAQRFLFEPNNAQTWMKLKGQAWTWLRQQWLNGAFYGKTEEEAFTLNIGLHETMTDEDIREGKMILQIQLALLAPAEFIQLSLTLDAFDGTASIKNGKEE